MAMPTRSALTTTNASLSHAPQLVSFRLFLTGINPQIARHRGCDQTRSRSHDHLRNHAQLIPDEHLSPDSPDPRSSQNTSSYPTTLGNEHEQTNPAHEKGDTVPFADAP